MCGTFNGALPQGAPTSPALSNLICRNLDRRLYRLSKKLNVKYSRYADDLAFSGDNLSGAFAGYVIKIVNDCGLSVNESKTRFYGPGGSKIVAGISLASGRPRLPRQYRRQLTQELYYATIYGVGNHLTHKGVRQPNYMDSLRGKVAFWLSVEPDNAFALRMKSLLAQNFSDEVE